MRMLILVSSAIAIGLAMYLGIVNVIDTVRYRHGWSLFYAFARFGLSILVFPITELVLRTGAIDPPIRGLLYVIGLLLCSVGFVGIAIAHRRHHGRQPPTAA